MPKKPLKWAWWMPWFHEQLEQTGYAMGSRDFGEVPISIKMLKFAMNLTDDGMVGQQVFARSYPIGLWPTKPRRRPWCFLEKGGPISIKSGCHDVENKVFKAGIFSWHHSLNHTPGLFWCCRYFRNPGTVWRCHWKPMVYLIQPQELSGRFFFKAPLSILRKLNPMKFCFSKSSRCSRTHIVELTIQPKGTLLWTNQKTTIAS